MCAPDEWFAFAAGALQARLRDAALREQLCASRCDWPLRRPDALGAAYKGSSDEFIEANLTLALATAKLARGQLHSPFAPQDPR